MGNPSQQPQQRRSLIEEFAARGVRLTSQRRVLLEVIQSSTEHLDAASLLRLARQRDARVDRATIYRTLELLKKMGLVDELDLMHLNGEKHYYEIRRDRDHIHLACFQCGKIEEYGSPLFERLKQEIVREGGFRIGVVRMEVGGRCRNCLKQPDPPKIS
jgi:Fur family transcriptional regulator, ferric uptake regulator